MTSRKKQGDGPTGPDRKAAPRESPRRPRAYPDPVDDTLDDTLPASDPPWWAGR